ncbi:division abnormally delayed protein isoform X1 [Onthophagus taurus]|uniref:division abnormally delayed protein isoform X1 n=1 Tax=Onthophagus taurus TaxID=166361 RepID=UPI0039BE62FE
MKCFVFLLFVCFNLYVVSCKNTAEGGRHYAAAGSSTLLLSRQKRNSNSGQQTQQSAHLADKNCSKIRESFPFLDQVDVIKTNTKGSFCNGDCCGQEAESLLRKHGQKELAKILKSYSRSLQGSLSTISTALQNYINEVAYQSENLTQAFAHQMYNSVAKDSISNFYQDIRNYIEIGNSDEVFEASPIDIKASVSTFFESLFPIAYKQALDLRDLTFEYKSCLKKYYNELQPFGETPRQMGQTLSKSLESTRLLFQALEMGIGVLNSSDSFMDETNKDNTECYDALLKMTYCPKCQGLSSYKPCSGYCLNVLRGCLSHYVVELDAPWNSYVEGIERLMTSMKQFNNEAMVNAGMVIKLIDTKLPDAVMYLLKKIKDLDTRVKRNCGPLKFAEKEYPLLSDGSAEVGENGGGGTGGGKQRMSSSRNFSQLPVAQINNFLTSIAQSKNFYDNLAENLCKEDFAETRDKKCWNGERIGEYTKTVVDANLGMEKYNPEVKPRMDITDPRIAALADKLRHVHQTVISSLGGVNLPEADNYVQQQGDDPDGGSGSGYGGIDEENETVYSGSGDGPSTEKGNGNRKGETPEYGRPDTTTARTPSSSNTTTFKPPLILLFILLLLQHANIE